MNQYLADIEYAATGVITQIWKEQTEISRLDAEVVRLSRIAEDKYRRAEAMQQNDDMDDYMMGVGLMWDAYFTEDKEAFHKKKELDAIRQTYLTHEFAINSLSGALLQFAKQGISIVHGGTRNCPNGRSIGSQHLKDVIWQGRNQSIHYEEANFSHAVVTCFNTLAADIDPKFSRYTAANMAFDIIDLLQWKTFADFQTDMMSLA
jgi:hypothetical protein